MRKLDRNEKIEAFGYWASALILAVLFVIGRAMQL